MFILVCVWCVRVCACVSGHVNVNDFSRFNICTNMVSVTLLLMGTCDLPFMKLYYLCFVIITNVKRTFQYRVESRIQQNSKHTRVQN